MLSRSTPNWNWGKVATTENPSVKFVSCRRRFINTSRSSQRNSIVCVINTHIHTNASPSCAFSLYPHVVSANTRIHALTLLRTRFLRCFVCTFCVQRTSTSALAQMCVKWKSISLNGCDVESNQVHFVSHTHTPNVTFRVAFKWTCSGERYVATSCVYLCMHMTWCLRYGFLGIKSGWKGLWRHVAELYAGAI